MAAKEMEAFEAIIRQTSEHWIEMLDPRGYVDGLDFKVRPYPFWSRRGPRCDQPFTYREYRRDLWRQRRARFTQPVTRRYNAATYRLSRAWDALRGREQDEWY